MKGLRKRMEKEKEIKSQRRVKSGTREQLGEENGKKRLGERMGKAVLVSQENGE